MERLKNNFSYYILSGFFLLALFNPWLKKYDYGAGFPLIALFAVILVSLFLAEFWRKRENGFWDKFFLAVFGVTYVISFHFSEVKNLSFPETAAYLSVIPVYLIFAHQRLNFEKKLYRIFCFAGLFAVILGYFVYFANDAQRMVGPFMNLLYHANFWPNAFGMFLLLVWPMLLINLIDRKVKIYHYLILSFLISGILLTFSRGAFIAFVGQVVLLGIFFWRSLTVKKIIYSIGVFALSLVLFYSANFVRGIAHNTIDVSERLNFENNEITTSYQERLDFMKGAFELSKEQPITGFGPFSFRYVYNPKQTIFLGASDHPHNMFLKFAMENGYVNLLAFLMFLMTLFVLILRRFKGLPDFRKKRVLILSVALLGMFAHNLIDYNLNFFSSLLLFFLILTLLRSNLIIEENLKARKSILALPFVVLVFFAICFEVLMILAPHIGFSGDTLDLRLYPRYEYLNRADSSLNEGNLEESLVYIEKELSLNPWDHKAVYLKGVIYCKDDFEGFDLEVCKELFGEALRLNPSNDIGYYRDYLRVMIRLGMDMDDEEFRAHFESCEELFHDYFYYVKFNVHFTSYTTMVNAAAEMIDLMIPYFDAEKREELEEKKAEMLKYQKQHLGGKTASIY